MSFKNVTYFYEKRLCCCTNFTLCLIHIQHDERKRAHISPNLSFQVAWVSQNGHWPFQTAWKGKLGLRYTLSFSVQCFTACCGLIHWENQIKHFEVLTLRSEFKWVTILTTLWTEYRLFNFRYCISMLQNFANGFFADFIKILFHCLSKWSAHVQLKKLYFVVGS